MQDTKGAKELLVLACDQFESAIYGKPVDSHLTLRYWALALKNIAQMLSASDEKWRLFGVPALTRMNERLTYVRTGVRREGIARSSGCAQECRVAPH